MRMILIAMCCLSMSAMAQHKFSFSSQNYVGLLVGENGSKFELQTINGFNHKTWFAGIGTGIDWYFQRSIPVYLSLNKSFHQVGTRNFFVALDGGINFPWKDDIANDYGDYQTDKLLPGFYWDGGFGYRIAMKNKHDALLLKLAYSYKNSAEKAGYDYPVYGPQDLTTRFNYHLRRLSINIGWSF